MIVTIIDFSVVNEAEVDVFLEFPCFLHNPTTFTIWSPVPLCLSFPGGSDGKEFACNAGDLDSIPRSGRFPGEGNGDPLQYSCLENPHGQRSPVGYSPWARKELDMTTSLSLSLHFPLCLWTQLIYLEFLS